MSNLPNAGHQHRISRTQLTANVRRTNDSRRRSFSIEMHVCLGQILWLRPSLSVCIQTQHRFSFSLPRPIHPHVTERRMPEYMFSAACTRRRKVREIFRSLHLSIQHSLFQKLATPPAQRQVNRERNMYYVLIAMSVLDLVRFQAFPLSSSLCSSGSCAMYPSSICTIYGALEQWTKLVHLILAHISRRYPALGKHLLDFTSIFIVFI